MHIISNKPNTRPVVGECFLGRLLPPWWWLFHFHGTLLVYKLFMEAAMNACRNGCIWHLWHPMYTVIKVWRMPSVFLWPVEFKLTVALQQLHKILLSRSDRCCQVPSCSKSVESIIVAIHQLRCILLVRSALFVPH